MFHRIKGGHDIEGGWRKIQVRGQHVLLQNDHPALRMQRKGLVPMREIHSVATVVDEDSPPSQRRARHGK